MNQNEIAKELNEMIPEVSYSNAFDLIPFLIAKRYIKMLGGDYSWSIKDFNSFKEEICRMAER